MTLHFTLGKVPVLGPLATRIGNRCRHFCRVLTFRREFLAFERQSQSADTRFRLSWKERLPCLTDRTNSTGFDRHYVYHPAWAARVLSQTHPEKHVDISSTLQFCAIVSAFIPVEFYDFRPADLTLPNLDCKSADLTSLPFADRSLSSVSCMHVIEHIGLGRYGDPLDPEGDLRACRELQRVLAPGGDLLVVVPVGEAALIEFNAHRIYDPKQIIDAFPELRLQEFTLIPENSSDGGLITNPADPLIQKQRYACGCFWFKR